MIPKNLNPLILPAIALCMTAATGHAATVLIGNTFPTIVSPDQGNTNGGSPGSQTVSTGGVSGQTFQTGVNVGGFVLRAVTFQVVGGFAAGTRDYRIRVGPLNGTIAASTAYNSVTTETATTTVALANNEYMTFTFATPISLLASTAYGADVSLISGSAISFNRTNSNINFAGGQIVDTSPTTLDMGITGNRDFIFHYDIEAVPEPSTALLGGLGLLALLRRRRA